MTALKPYPAYRDSGIEWLGDVPEHWDVRQLGRFGRLSKGNGGTKEDELPDGVPCVRYGDIYTQHQFFVRKSRSCVSPERARDYTPIRYGDVLFTGSGETIEEIGKSVANLTQAEACCGGDIILFRPSIELDARFIGYASDCRQAALQKSRMGRGVTVMHLYGDQLKYTWIALPPVPEQATIAGFLDHTGRRIAHCIRAKQKLIKMLEEQKQVIIHRAITGQIEMRTGEHYPAYKGSGFDWLDKVPEDWSVRRLKTMCAMKSGDGITAMSIEPSGEYPVYGGNGLRGYTDAFTHEGDFALIGRQGALCGNVHLVHGQFWASEHAVVATLRPDYALEWFGSLLRVMNLNQYSIAAAQPGLAVERILNLPVPVPTREEQEKISEQIDIETTSAAKAISSALRQIDLVREYHTRLVADVVTGKLDVREAAAGLPDEADEVEFAEDEELLNEGERADQDIELETALEEVEA